VGSHLGVVISIFWRYIWQCNFILHNWPKFLY